MNLRFKEIFSGKVVNKRLTFNTGMDEFPRYVLEYLGVEPARFVAQGHYGLARMRKLMP